jgi:hypothetical protein
MQLFEYAIVWVYSVAYNCSQHEVKIRAKA